MQGKAEDAGGLTPAKDDNAAMRALYPRTFARNSDDCYSVEIVRHIINIFLIWNLHKSIAFHFYYIRKSTR